MGGSGRLYLRRLAHLFLIVHVRLAGWTSLQVPLAHWHIGDYLVFFSQDADRPEAYQFRLWVIFEDKASIDILRHATSTESSADSEPHHEDSDDTSRSKRANRRTPESTEKGPHAFDFKLRVPVVPPLQMKDGGVGLADLLPYVSGSVGVSAHLQSANERQLDNIDKMMEAEGKAPEGWRDIDVRIEPASMSPPFASTIFPPPGNTV